MSGSVIEHVRSVNPLLCAQLLAETMSGSEEQLIGCSFVLRTCSTPCGDDERIRECDRKIDFGHRQCSTPCGDDERISLKFGDSAPGAAECSTPCGDDERISLQGGWYRKGNEQCSTPCGDDERIRAKPQSTSWQAHRAQLLAETMSGSGERYCAGDTDR